MFKNRFLPPIERFAINVGCLFDISSGHYVPGVKGEYILNGGVMGITGVVARPNNFKSELIIYFNAMVRRAFHKADTLIYDSEGTLHAVQRLSKYKKLDGYLDTIDFDHDEHTVSTDVSRYNGDEFFNIFREAAKTRGKEQDKHLYTTPFADRENKPRKAIYPAQVDIDSLSKFNITTTDNIYDKGNIGESDLNTEAMNSGKAKKQMFNQLTQLVPRGGFYMFMSAHVTDVINMEMYAKDKRSLAFLEKDTTLAGVSKGFFDIPTNIWMVYANRPLQSKDKTPEYPRGGSSERSIQGDTDLLLLSIKNLRGKNGITGLPFNIIASQSEGILPSLTEFHFCKENGRFGLEGNLQNYAMTLLPSVRLQRTKIRQKLDSDPALRKAVKFTADLLQLWQLQHIQWGEYLCTPEELYRDLTKMGYDWSVLLNTRDYWVPEEESKEHLPFLSIIDLLRMRKSEYVPYWFTPEQRSAIKPVDFETDTPEPKEGKKK